MFRLVLTRMPRKLVLLVPFAVIVSLLASSTALGALVSGSLPAAAFTYTSDAVNSVNVDGTGIHLKTKGSVDVKTTYNIKSINSGWEAGWHYHNGPVLVTVTVGTVTYFDSTCQSWNVSAGQTYIESTGQVTDVKVLASQNTGGNATVEWFTTRLYPDGAADPVPVSAPCTP